MPEAYSRVILKRTKVAGVGGCLTFASACVSVVRRGPDQSIFTQLLKVDVHVTSGAQMGGLFCCH